MYIFNILRLEYNFYTLQGLKPYHSGFSLTHIFWYVTHTAPGTIYFICILLKFNIAGIHSDMGLENSSRNAGLRPPRRTFILTFYLITWHARVRFVFIFIFRIVRVIVIPFDIVLGLFFEGKESIFVMKRVRGCLVSIVWISFLLAALQGQRFVDPFCTIWWLCVQVREGE